MKRPAFQFYPADWRKDAALQSCSLSAQGLWVNMLCIAHECDPYGHLTINGKPMSGMQIARLVGVPGKDCDRILLELLDAGVVSRTDETSEHGEGVFYSRRMVRDEDVRNRRAEGGKAGSEHGAKGAEHGFKGGRPAKARGVSEPPLEPPPSSSSSSSSSDIPPVSPKGGRKPSVGLGSWLEARKAANEKPIPESDPIFTYAEKVGIPDDFLRLAWLEFKRRHMAPEGKRYSDWRRVFRKTVEGNWLKLWWLDPGNGQYGLTTVGLQAKRATEERRQA